jgi:hypothetical protein
MQNWQFYLHMLALCVIILLLYLFFREYRLHHSKTAPACDAAPVVATPSHAFPAQTPLSHAHIQAIQSMAAASTTRPGVHATASNRFETESNLDRELSSEINDLCATQEVVDDADSDAGSSPSNSSASSQGHVESANGSPLPKVIEFVPKKKRRSVKLPPT